MKPRTPRLAVRALILREDRLLLVNAWPGLDSDLWCAPGGGVLAGASLAENLVREVQEETGLTVAVGAPALVNEFHDPVGGFHQVELFFRCRVVAGDTARAWTDVEGVVNRQRWVARAGMDQVRFKPDLLPEAAWGNAAVPYDALETIVR